MLRMYWHSPRFHPVHHQHQGRYEPETVRQEERDATREEPAHTRWTSPIAVFYTFFENVYFLFQFFLLIQFQPYKFAAEDKLQKTEFYSATSSDASAYDQHIAAAECTRFFIFSKSTII